jgi:tetratricopeptide (TPR) repeat protein
MSQFRLASISLILAALGLNAAPAVHAADAKSSASASAPAVPPQDVVRIEMAKILDTKKFSELISAKKYDEAEAILKAGEAFPNPNPEEAYVLLRLHLALASSKGDNPAAIKYLEAILATGKLQAADRPNFVEALSSMYFNQGNYAKSIEWMKVHVKETGSPEKTRVAMSRAYYLSNDFANAKVELLAMLAENDKAGKPTSEKDLAVLSNAAAKLKDIPTYIIAKERLVAINPTDDNWTDLLHRVLVKQTFNQRLTLDVFRLEAMAVKTMQPEEYTEMAELDLQAGFPTEAKKLLDAGFAANVLGTGSDGPKHKKLRDQANKGSADDIKNIAAGEVSAAKSKNGHGLVNLGYAYVSMEQYDKGIELIQKGIAKGGLKNADDAVLRLGTAYAKAGRKEEALKVFAGLKGDDGLSDLAKYWTMWLNRPVAAAPAAK